MTVEQEYMEMEALCDNRVAEMEKEVEGWKKQFHVEARKNERLREQISRTERELYGILQRKYELIRGPQGGRPGQAGGPFSRRGSLQADSLLASGSDSGRSPSSSSIHQMSRTSPHQRGANAGSRYPGIINVKTENPTESRQDQMVEDLGEFLGL